MEAKDSANARAVLQKPYFNHPAGEWSKSKLLVFFLISLVIWSTATVLMYTRANSIRNQIQTSIDKGVLFSPKFRLEDLMRHPGEGFSLAIDDIWIPGALLTESSSQKALVVGQDKGVYVDSSAFQLRLQQLFKGEETPYFPPGSPAGHTMNKLPTRLAALDTWTNVFVAWCILGLFVFLGFALKWLQKSKQL